MEPILTSMTNDFGDLTSFGGPDWEAYATSGKPTLGLSPIDLAVMERDPEILHKLITTKSYDRINETYEEGTSNNHNQLNFSFQLPHAF